MRRFRGYQEPQTGEEAAEKYLHRKSLHAGRGSSLRKLQRYFNIKAGLRPLCYGDLARRAER